MARTIAGIFPDQTSAEHAIVDLKTAGFDPRRMGIVMRDRSDAREVARDQGISSAAGAVTGGVIGGTAGALLVATGTLAVPGIGPFITGGVLATLVGGATGWLVGGLVGLGLAPDEAEYYQNRVEQGGILLAVESNGSDEEARRIMLNHGAEDMQSEGGMSRRPAMDEDIIQGRMHGSVGDEDVVTDRRDWERAMDGMDAVDEREQRTVGR